MFYVVGVGASAGGLEALEKFFGNMPPDNNIAFIVIQHLSPDYKSLMAELLSKYTTMELVKAEDAMEVQPNCVYLIPPRKNMTIFNGRLYLNEQTSSSGLNLPIDIFFRSLAEDQGERAIGIVLSGTGSDGTNGIRAIKEAGGMVMAQDEFSAQFDGMPKSAIITGLVDYVLSPEDMPSKLLEFIKNPAMDASVTLDRSVFKDEESLNRIFSLLKNASGLDFTYYKQSTVIRRLERRMSINQLSTLGDYLLYLQKSPNEVKTVCNEILIGVTKFFRDTEAFDILQQKVIPKIIESKSPREAIRVWVAGCSTGEEAYSVAILFREAMERAQSRNEVKIFATDIDKESIEFAGLGCYPEGIAADVPDNYLEKYFTRQGKYYQINRDIRDMLVFAAHNLIKDPPFNKIDLVTCRNLMIYLQPVLQKKVLAFFHYSLNDCGFLFLGSSETVGEMNHLFQPFENKWKFYTSKGGVRTSPDQMDIPHLSSRSAIYKSLIAPNLRDHVTPRTMENLYKIMIRDFMPPCIIIDENYEVVMVCGDANKYLQVPIGLADFNILNMVSKKLSTTLSSAIRKAVKNRKEVVYQDIEDKDENSVLLGIHIKPVYDERSQQKLLAITFREIDKVEKTDSDFDTFDASSDYSERIRDLEQELQFSRENLQATIEELETSNEELQATNEELLSSNEELQSTNEELQSVNEELITVNSEYQQKILELTELNDDMDNFLSSTNIGTIFLDRDLKIRKFTKAATRIINLIEYDVGRPISHISHKLIGVDIEEESRKVLETLIPTQKEVSNPEGAWYLNTMFPYKTKENIIKGVVITFVDITELKNTNKQLAKFSSAIEQSPVVIVITDLEGRFEYVNPKFEEVTGYSAAEVAGKPTKILKSGVGNPAQYEELWQTISSGGKWVGTFCNTKRNGGLYWEKASISPVKDVNGHIINYIKIAEEITEPQ